MDLADFFFSKLMSVKVCVLCSCSISLHGGCAVGKWVRLNCYRALSVHWGLQGQTLCYPLCFWWHCKFFYYTDGWLLLLQICVNDELVSKKFAYYSEESGRGGLDPWGRIPVKFCSILTQIDSTSSIKLEAVKPPPTSGKHTFESPVPRVRTGWGYWLVVKTTDLKS